MEELVIVVAVRIELRYGRLPDPKSVADAGLLRLAGAAAGRPIVHLARHVRPQVLVQAICRLPPELHPVQGSRLMKGIMSRDEYFFGRLIIVKRYFLYVR
jgi:hypothetical protein